MEISHKVIPFRGEVKADGDGTRFTGYASTFGNEDKGGDTVVAGAFKETLLDREYPVRMLWNHDTHAVPIGKWLSIEEDDDGLKVEGELTPGNSLAEDVAAAMRHGTIDRMSIGYMSLDDERTENGGRLLKKLKLFEISPVNFPMNTSAAIAGVKSQVEGLESLKDFEHMLRDAAGFSSAAATAFVSRFKQVCRSDFDSSAVKEIEAIKARDARTQRALELLNDYSIGGNSK